MADVIPLRSVEPEQPSHEHGDPTPLVVDAKRLAKLLCCGLRTVRTHDAVGRLPSPIRIGGRVVWRVDEIREWLAAGAPDRETWAKVRATRK